MAELSRKPQMINEDCWYYEESFGIEIIHKLPERQYDNLHIKIPWRKISASVKRYEAIKQKHIK